MAAPTSLTASRTTIAEKLAKDGSTVSQHRSGSLFGMVDEDGSGTIDRSEFGKLYDAIKAEVSLEHAKEAELERKKNQAQRKLKIISIIALIMAIFLGTSVAANFAVMFYIVDAQVKTSADPGTGTMTMKGSANAVVTGSLVVDADSAVAADGTVALGKFGEIVAKVAADKCDKAIRTFELTGETTVNTKLLDGSGTTFDKVTMTDKSEHGYFGTMSRGTKLLLVQNAKGEDCDVYKTVDNAGVTAGTGRRKLQMMASSTDSEDCDPDCGWPCAKACPKWTVICTELHAQGRLPANIYEADVKFQKGVDPAAYAGYRLWAVHVVKLMRISSTVTDVVEFFAKPWAMHMAYMMGAAPEDNLFGRVLMNVAMPICYVLGKALELKIVATAVIGLGFVLTLKKTKAI